MEQTKKRASSAGRRFADTSATALAFAAVAFLCIGLWRLSSILMLIFLAVLWAVLMSRTAKWIQLRLPFLSYIASLLGLVIIFVVGLAVALTMAAPTIFAEATIFVEQLPPMWAEIKRTTSMWGIPISELQTSFFSDSWDNLAKGASGFFSTVSRAPTALVIILSVGFFFSLQPDRYQDGLVAFVPASGRDKFRSTTNRIVDVLWSWLVGRAIAMLAVGLLAGAGLAFLGLPFAILLAVVAGLCNFVPTIGPILGAAPALVVATAQGGTMLLWTAGIYLVIQQIENNLVTPFVQDNFLDMPPAVVILSQLVAGILFGVAGVVAAVPLVASVYVFVEEYYFPAIESGAEE